MYLLELRNSSFSLCGLAFTFLHSSDVWSPEQHVDTRSLRLECLSFTGFSDRSTYFSSLGGFHTTGNYLSLLQGFSNDDRLSANFFLVLLSCCRICLFFSIHAAALWHCSNLRSVPATGWLGHTLPLKHHAVDFRPGLCWLIALVHLLFKQRGRRMGER